MLEHKQGRKKAGEPVKSYIRHALAWEFLRRNKEFQKTYQGIAETFPQYVQHHSRIGKKWIIDPEWKKSGDSGTPEIRDASFKYFGNCFGFFPSPDFPFYDTDGNGYMTALIKFESPSCAAHSYYWERIDIPSIARGMLFADIMQKTEAKTEKERHTAEMKLGQEILKYVKIKEKRKWPRPELLKGDLSVSINLYGDINQQLCKIQAFVLQMREALKQSQFQSPAKDKWHRPKDQDIQKLRAYDAVDIYGATITELSETLHMEDEAASGRECQPGGSYYIKTEKILQRGRQLVESSWKFLL